MSTTDIARQALHGVTLEQYAIIRAGVEDGLPLGQLLGLTGVVPKSWVRAEDAWHERLIADLDVEGPVTAVLDELMRRAQRRWLRRIPPLDTDLRSWLDFERAWAPDVDGDAFLDTFGMRPSDMTRLATLWAERLEADPALAAQALTILADEPGRLCEPKSEPVRLPPSGSKMEP